MNTKTSSARKLALSAMTAGALAASIAVASPASAVTIKTGYGKINNQGLAVGTNIDPIDRGRRRPCDLQVAPRAMA